MAEGEFALAKTSVWWDIENCAVPKGFNAHNIALNISAALANEGYRGETEIAAYGDTSKINTSVQHALNSAGVNLNHVPAGVKDGADKKILVDVFMWALAHPPPANYLLISGDRDFSNALHKLRLKGYNILLAHLPNVSQALVGAAKCKWLWSSLAAGGPSRNADSSLKSSATDTDSGNSSEGIEETQNAHGNGNPTEAPKKSKRPTPGMQDKRNGIPENNNGKANQKQQTDQVSATDEVSEAHSNAESSLKSGATDTDSGIPSECFEQTQNAHENGNHADRQLVKLTSKAPKKSKRPTPGMQDKRNGSPENNNGKENQKQQTDQVSATDEVSEAHSNAKLSLKSAATDTDSGIPSECFEQTQNAHENGNHADRQPVELTSKAPKKSKRPAPGMQDKRNGSCGKNNTKSNEKKQADQVSSTDQVSEAHVNGQSKNNAGPMTSTSSSTSSEFPSNSGNNQARPGPALRPNEKNLAQPPFAPPGNLRASSSQGNNFYHQHNPEMRPRFLDKPQNSNPVQNFEHFPPGWPGYLVPASNNGNTGANNGTGFSGGREFLQFCIDTILRALRILRKDKMAPTETNIGDCILFGERKHPSFNVRLGLDYAMRYGMIVELFGYYLPLYIPKGEIIWDCINIMDENARHPKETWDTVQKYMSSPIGRAVLLHTKCMYEAAMVLKTCCLKDLPLGTVLQILQLTIDAKKWVVPHSSGWQPVAIYLPLSQMK